MTISAITGRPFPRGARPTPRHKLLAVQPFVAPLVAPPTEWARVPQQLSVWGNDRYGDCVSAEEAFAKACYLPEIFIPEATVIDWARRHGWLNGAYLTEVMDAMYDDGFQVGSQRYNDGKYRGIDYSDEGLLNAAIYEGPIKIAIDANALPSGAGNQQGWFATKKGNYPNTDHCVTLSSFGRADFLYDALKVPLPSGLSPSILGRLLFTWGTQGFVTQDWLMGTCVEAYVRNPTTIGVPPLTPPPPPPPPVVYTPPFFLFEGSMDAPVQIGALEGYDNQETAHNAAVAFAEHDKVPVMVHDAGGLMVETVSPTPPTPPAPQTVTVQFPLTHCIRSGLGNYYVPAMTLRGTVDAAGQFAPTEMPQFAPTEMPPMGSQAWGFFLYVLPVLVPLITGGYTNEEIAAYIAAALAAYIAHQPLPPLPH